MAASLLKLHLHREGALLADIPKQAPAPGAAGVQRQAPAPGHRQVAAVGAQRCVPQRPVGCQVRRRRPQMLHLLGSGLAVATLRPHLTRKGACTLLADVTMTDRLAVSTTCAGAEVTSRMGCHAYREVGRAGAAFAKGTAAATALGLLCDHQHPIRRLHTGITLSEHGPSAHGS